MAFSPDGKLVAAAGPDGVVRVWIVSDGQRRWSLVGNDSVRGAMISDPKKPSPSTGLAFNEAGTLLANTISEKTVIWSMTSGERVWTHAGNWGEKFLFLGDSSFAAASDSGIVRIYPRPGAGPIRSFRVAPRKLDVMERSRDGRWLIVQSRVDSANLWSLADGVPGPSMAVPSTLPSQAIAFSPDGSTVAIAGGRHGLYLWDTKTGQPLRSFQKFPGYSEKAWFTADGRSIVTFSKGIDAFRIVHLDPGKQRIVAGTKSPEPVQAWWGGYLQPANGPPHPRSISGFVRDVAGKAIVLAEVSLYDGDRPGSARIARVSTNAAGYYLVENVAPTHVIVRAEKQGFARETIYVHVPTRWIDKDIRMRKIGR